MSKPTQIIWIVVIAVVTAVVSVAFIAILAVCSRTRTPQEHIETSALTHVVIKDHNPDLISKQKTNLTLSVFWPSKMFILSMRSITRNAFMRPVKFRIFYI